MRAGRWPDLDNNGCPVVHLHAPGEVADRMEQKAHAHYEKRLEKINRKSGYDDVTDDFDPSEDDIDHFDHHTRELAGDVDVVVEGHKAAESLRSRGSP